MVRGWCFERKSAQSAGEAGHFEIQFLGMAVRGIEHVAQRRESGIDGVQKPEAGNLAARVAGFAGVGGAAAGQRVALVFEDFDQALGQASSGAGWR